MTLSINLATLVVETAAVLRNWRDQERTLSEPLLLKDQTRSVLVRYRVIKRTTRQPRCGAA